MESIDMTYDIDMLYLRKDIALLTIKKQITLDF